MEAVRLVEPQIKGPVIETIDLTPIDPVGSMVDVPLQDDPERSRRWAVRTKLFIGLVAAPTFVAAVYLFLIAAPRYVSEASFVVRSANYQSTPAAGAMAGAASLAASHGEADLSDAVNTYLLSRDVVEKLDDEGELKGILSRPESDFLSRFPNIYSKDNREQLFRHYRSIIQAEVDKSTGISTISAVTFRPEDSQRLVRILLQHSEDLINRLNDRMVKDGESYARSLAKRAQDRVVEVGMRLLQFRTSVGSVDPSRESAAALDQIAQMSTEVAEMQATLQQQISLSPASPAIPPLRERIRTYQEQIEQEKSKIVGADKSLAAKLSEFEQLTLERQLAAKELDSASAGLNAALQDAQRQHLYLQRIAGPNLADEAKYPRRVLGVVLTFALCMVFFAVVNSLYRGVIEHQR